MILDPRFPGDKVFLEFLVDYGLVVIFLKNGNLLYYIQRKGS